MTTTNSCGAIPAQPTAYLRHFETTYNPGKSGPPRFARLVLTENRLRRKPVQIPETGAGPFLVRIQGTHPARDGEIFECVDPMHAEVFVVFRPSSSHYGGANPKRSLKMNRCSRDFLPAQGVHEGASSACLKRSWRLSANIARSTRREPRPYVSYWNR